MTIAVVGDPSRLDNGTGPRHETVVFYARVGETTFRTDPVVVAAAFLNHRLGRKATATRHTRYYLDRFLAEYLTRMGASWARLSDTDHHQTRQSYDAVRCAVDARLTALQAATDTGSDGPLIASPERL